ncbi:MAG: hypothetical protein AUG89_08505 [Acidobacteria bacterium 13_1_20CM_4_56_7]|nr:MAG: hypothetical protein AUG89_08505 [Acidobacteria bacterium 13_1_20CM_4_56_7]
MRSPRHLFSILAILITSAAWAVDKKPLPPAPAKSLAQPVTNEFIQKQFGENCTVLPGLRQFIGDFDGDGIDDLVVAAKCKNPMADRDELDYVVADPFDTFMGFGDVKVTSSFASDVPERRGIAMLIIHGADKDAWQAEKPKAKFLLINLPFKTLTVKKYSLKKKAVLGIYMEEQGAGESNSSVIYWDGKKYRYVQLGSTME